MGLLAMIGNGLRQHGIFPPLLFNFYMNSLIENIQQMRQECSLCYETNTICYEDDILLLLYRQSLIDTVCYFLDELVYKCN